MLEKLKSRKLIVVVGLIITVIGAALTGEVAWAEAIEKLAILGGAYMVGQGLPDAAAQVAPIIDALAKKKK